jgi:hypothetical protein
VNRHSRHRRNHRHVTHIADVEDDVLVAEHTEQRRAALLDRISRESDEIRRKTRR